MQITRHVDIPLLPQTHVGLYKLAKADKAAYPRFQFCDMWGVSLDALLGLSAAKLQRSDAWAMCTEYQLVTTLSLFLNYRTTRNEHVISLRVT